MTGEARGRSRPDAAVLTVRGGEGLEAIRALFREYVPSIPSRPMVPGFEEELRQLPGPYAPPDGALLLARLGAAPVGCVGVRRLDPARCELKRLYVRPIARGRGIGRALTDAAIAFARRAGYRVMMLDTLPEMAEALRLYVSLGFREVAPYWASPAPGTRYFALPLRPPRRPGRPRGTSK